MVQDTPKPSFNLLVLGGRFDRFRPAYIYPTPISPSDVQTPDSQPDSSVSVTCFMGEALGAIVGGVSTTVADQRGFGMCV